MSPTEVPFWEAVDRIRERDPHYRREAYGFVLLALGLTVQGLPAKRREDPDQRHLSGQELLRGVVALAQREFGVMAGAVFHEWGLRAGSDVGELVFQLVECGQLSARPEDRREDFAGLDLIQLLGQGVDLARPGETATEPGRPARGTPGSTP